MTKIKIGEVSELEKNDLLIKYERILALKEVIATLNNDSVDKVIIQKLEKKAGVELPKAVEAFNVWWTSKSEKYGWVKQANTDWSIDFKTNEIFIAPNNKCLTYNTK